MDLERLEVLKRTCSSEAKDGGFEFGPKRMSGWMSWGESVEVVSEEDKEH